MARGGEVEGARGLRGRGEGRGKGQFNFLAPGIELPIVNFADGRMKMIIILDSLEVRL
jgi:hypothetical protein